jgi:hypothetical protein
MATRRREELRGEALAALPLDRCSVCTRGREACSYCEHIDERDWEAICDCGLLDFGRHIIDCKPRDHLRYVIAQDPAEALQPRTKGTP